MDYLQWNDAIASHFFSSEKDGSRVFLYVTPELIEQLGADCAEPLDDFILAALTGPPWVTPTKGFCQKALQTFEGWRDRGLDYPPYITSLALFVLAAGHEGDFAAHAYYPRLWKLLGQDKTKAPPSFTKMYILWSDLEEWSQFDMDGRKGIFYAYLPGDWMHVGLPTAQTLLTEQEINWFPQVFDSANLDPTIEISDDELFMLMAKHGAHYLRPITLKFLRNPKGVHSELRNLLGEVLQDHLHGWHGRVVLESQKKVRAKSLASLVLCCRSIDKVAGQFKMELRCKTAHQLPEEGVHVKAPNAPEEEFEIKSSLMQWSSPLADAQGKCLDPGEIDWTQKFILIDDSEGFEFRLRGKKLRIFISAFSCGFQGYVEVDRIINHKAEFYLFVHNSIQDKIMEWGANGGCEKISLLKFSQGLPESWSVYKVDTIISDAAIKLEFPSLAMPASTRIQFVDGIRVSKGNIFFDFVRPNILVDSCEELTEVICDGKVLSKMDDGLYKLPENLRQGCRYIVDVKSSEQSIAQKSFALESSFSVVNEIEDVGIDEFGLVSKNSSDSKLIISGAYVHGADVPDFVFTVIPELSELAYRKVVLLGRVPGQIVVWPISGELEWQPVWAIIIQGRRNIKTLFCGKDFDSSMPCSRVNLMPSKAVKQWKEILWHKRKRTNAPENKIEQKLWEKYLDIAENV